MRHLIDPQDVSKYARPCDVDTHIIERAIEEAELLDIRPKIGDALFLRLTSDAATQHDGASTRVDVLLTGGEYIGKCGNERYFVGLRRALAYYTWARLVKTGVNHLTRFGFVQKRDEYSDTTEYRERQTAYNDAFAVADGYMEGCLDYLRANPGAFPDYTLRGRVAGNRTKYRVIGK